MAETGTTVGTIALDLVIKEQLGKQLESIRAAVRAPAEKVGETMAEAVEKPMQNVSDIAEKTVNKAMKKVKIPVDNGFEDAFKGLLEREEKQKQEMLKAANSVSENVSESSGNFIKYNFSEIEKEVDKFTDSIGKKAGKANKKLSEIGGSNAAKDMEIKFHFDGDKAVKKMQEVQDISDKTMKLRVDSKTAEVNIDEAAEHFSHMKSKLEEPVKANVRVNTDEVGTAEQRCEKAFDRIKNTFSKIVKPKVNLDTDSAESAVNRVNSQINEVTQNAREQLEQAGKFEVSGKPLERLAQQIELAYEKVDILQKKWQELSAVDDPTAQQMSQLNSLENQIISATADIDKLESKYSKLAKGGKSAFSAIMQAASKTFSFIRKTGGRAFSVLKRTGSLALDGLKKKFGTVGKTADSMSKPITKLGRTIKNTFRRVFVTATLFAAVRALKSAFSDIMAQNKELSDSLNQVKANLAAAFMPIMQAVMPALNAFMSGLAAVTKQVAGFMAGLFGTTYGQAANAAKKLKDTAKTAQDTAKKVKTAMAGIDEMNVLSSGDSSDSKDSDEEQSGIDWSKVDMSEPKLPDWAERLKDAIKSGDWQGAGEIFAERVNSVFERVDWDKISEKVNRGITKVTNFINGFVHKVDWNALGEFVAGGINTVTSAINTFFGGVDWDALGKGLAQGLNSAVSRIDWVSAGEALVAKLNAIIDTAYAFVSEFDFETFGTSVGDGINAAFSKLKLKKAGAALGKSLTGVINFASGVLKKVDFSGIGKEVAESINAVFDNIDFAKAGSTLSDAVKGVFDFLIAVVKNIKWREIGEKLSEFVANIDFAGIAQRVFTLLGMALAAAVSLAWGFIKSTVKSIQEFFTKEFEEMDTGSIGLDIILGVLKGIVDGIIGIGKWLYENVALPIINGFKEVFDIHSPSKVMAELGGYLIDGLLGAVSEGIAAVKKIFSDMLAAVKKTFDKIDTWFTKKFKKAWDGIKDIFKGIGDWFGDRYSDITGKFKNADSWFKEKFSTARKHVNDSFSDVGSWFGSRYSDIKTAFSEVGDWFRGKFSEARENTNSSFSDLGGWFSDRWDDVQQALSSVSSWFGDIFSGAWTNVCNAFADCKNFFTDRWNDITGIFSGIGDWFGDRWNDVKNKLNDVPEWLRSKFQSAYDSVTGIWNNIGQFFWDVWEMVSDRARDGMNWFMGRIEDSLNRAIDFLNSWGFDLPDGSWFGLSIGYVNLPRLAKGGLATAPTLAMVGDNRNASVDPEVIAPLSKLQGMIGSDPEVAEILRAILELLKQGVNIEIINYMFRNSREFSREVLNVFSSNEERSGK